MRKTSPVDTDCAMDLATRLVERVEELELKIATLESSSAKPPPNAKKKHETAPLPQALETFDILKEAPGVKALDGADLREMERQILANPGDTKVHSQLRERVERLQAEYKKVITDRLQEKGRVAKWMLVIKAGTDDFRGVYDQVFNLIRSSEASGFQEYDQEYLELARLIQQDPAGKKKQTPTTAVELYVEAARAKPFFDAAIKDLETRFRQAAPGAELSLSICPTLKKVSRIVSIYMYICVYIYV